MASVGSTVVNPGEVVGLFDLAGISSPTLSGVSAIGADFKIVGSEEGDGPAHEFTMRGTYITSEEIYLKNVSDRPQKLSVLIMKR